MNTPLVSIIIPTYNRAHLIGETLDSILAQTYTNWECIVVDDGSSDHTDELMLEYTQKDPRILYVHRPNTHLAGGNGARNYGFQLSKGEYLNWFDSDDLMLKNFLKLGVAILLEKQLDFVLFDYKVFSQTTGKTFIHQVNKTENLIEDYVTFKINFGTCAIVWDRRIISGFRFNEKLTKAQDLDFNFRVLTSTKYNYTTVNEFGFLVRGHSDSIVQEYKRNNIKSITSELFARKNVFFFMINQNYKSEVLERCFELYTLPLLKVLREKKHAIVFRELYSMLLVNNKLWNKNILWFFKAIFHLFVNLIFDKGEYRLKHVILNYRYK